MTAKDIRIAKEKTYTIIPSPAFACVEPLLQEAGIEYKTYSGFDAEDVFPSDIPLRVYFRGKVYDPMRTLAYVESHMDPGDLLQLADQVCYPEEPWEEDYHDFLPEACKPSEFV